MKNIDLIMDVHRELDSLVLTVERCATIKKIKFFSKGNADKEKAIKNINECIDALEMFLGKEKFNTKGIK